MAPRRRVQHHREHSRAGRGASGEDEAFRTPNNSGRQSGAHSNGSTSGSQSAATSSSSSATPPDEINYQPYSEDDHNLDAEEAGGDSDVEGTWTGTR